jgi:hypothetical protein
MVSDLEMLLRAVLAIGGAGALGWDAIADANDGRTRLGHVHHVRCDCTWPRYKSPPVRSDADHCRNHRRHRLPGGRQKAPSRESRSTGLRIACGLGYYSGRDESAARPADANDGRTRLGYSKWTTAATGAQSVPGRREPALASARLRPGRAPRPPGGDRRYRSLPAHALGR